MDHGDAALEITDREQARRILQAFLDYMRLNHQAHFWTPDRWSPVRMSEDFVPPDQRIAEFLRGVETKDER